MAVDLTGRVAIVTGAGGGPGRAHMRHLAQHGPRVVGEIEASGGDARTTAPANGD